MIVLVQGDNRSKFLDLVDQMHVLRARVFGGRLGWEVEVVDGRERDRFDDLEPLYVIAVDTEGRVVGSLRALQTTGPNMLTDVFGCLMAEGEAVRSPLIWESTRFCVDTERAARGGINALSYVTGELLCGLFEAALAAGLSHVVSVFDVRMERILNRAGCLSERLGPPQMIGNVRTMAGLFEVSEAMVARLHAVNGIPYPTLSYGDRQHVALAA